jgi:phosphonatase-like hydrolase
MIKMIVFDMAGTVINENNVVYKTVQSALNHAGIEVTLDQVLAEGAGKEKSKAISDLIQKYTPSKADQFAADVHSAFVGLLEEAYKSLEVYPMEGAEEVFNELKQRGIYTVLNTGYNRHVALQLTTKLNWIIGTTVDGLITASDVPSTRPYPDMILHAMKMFAIDDPNQLVKIGDSQIDIEEGKNAKCRFTVGITTGAHTRSQLLEAKPDFIIDSLHQLLPILKL